MFSQALAEHIKKPLKKIKQKLKPQSFNTKKVVSIKNKTEHVLNGIGCNVIGLLEGTEPQLKNEVIILGGHLDHLGRCYEIIPGANDNASAVSVILGFAEALSKCHIKPKRTVMFLCFGAEEQAVLGSRFYLENPKFPLEKTLCLINMDGVGCGDQLRALAGKNFPSLWGFIENANNNFIHRNIIPTHFANLTRPRLDAARFLWAGIPSISFLAFGTTSYYHVTKDNINYITPEILEDLAQLVFLAVLDMANQDSLDFRENRN